jgi:DNA-binding transcriptional LysR family regulator
MADRRLEVFHMVARMLSFTKAAEVLEMTQPAVTFQIRQLEEEYNARLFDRSHNKIDLTEAGRRVFEYTEKIFELYREMEHAIRDVTGQVSGTLRMGATVAIGDYVLPKLLVAFKRDFPSVNIQLKLSTISGIASMVENSAIDIGMLDTDLDNKMIGSEQLTYDEMVLVMPAGHALANSGPVSVAQFISEPLILLEQGSGIQNDFTRYLSEQGYHYDKLNIVMELGSLEAIKGAIESGLGLGILPRSALAKEIELKRLQAACLAPAFQNTLSFVFKKQKFPMRNLEELIQFAKSYYEQERESLKPLLSVSKTGE